MQDLPHPHVHEHLSPLLVWVGSLRPGDLEHAHAHLLGAEDRTQEVGAQVIDQRRIVKPKSPSAEPIPHRAPLQNAPDQREGLTDVTSAAFAAIQTAPTRRFNRPHRPTVNSHQR